MWFGELPKRRFGRATSSAVIEMPAALISARLLSWIRIFWKLRTTKCNTGASCDGGAPNFGKNSRLGDRELLLDWGGLPWASVLHQPVRHHRGLCPLKRSNVGGACVKH